MIILTIRLQKKGQKKKKKMIKQLLDSAKIILSITFQKTFATSVKND